MLSVTYIMLVLVLLLVVGVGMQQCMTRNQNEMDKLSKGIGIVGFNVPLDTI